MLDEVVWVRSLGVGIRQVGAEGDQGVYEILYKDAGRVHGVLALPLPESARGGGVPSRRPRAAACGRGIGPEHHVHLLRDRELLPVEKPSRGRLETETRLAAAPTTLRLERRGRTLLGFVRQGSED